MNNDFLPINEEHTGTENNQLFMVPMVDNGIFEQAKKMAGTVVEYRELRMMYSCAIKEIRTKFDVLNSEFNVRYQRNPIASITSRLKSSASIMEKLARLSIVWRMHWPSRMILRYSILRIILKIPSRMAIAAII